jgi:hypothetical protein
MFGLRRKFKIPDKEEYYLIFKKPWGNSMGISLEGKLNYILVYTADFKSYTFLDYEGEDDGFDTYIGAEQFLRAYLVSNYKELPNRWYINKFKRKENGYLEDLKTGDEIEY